MNIYLAVALWWLIVPALAVFTCVGLVTFMDRCREHARRAEQWEDLADPVPAAGLTAAGDESLRPGSRASCVGRTGQVGGVMPREWTTARSRPYDRERDDAA